ncbi:Zinc-metallopeptidase, peroxisomal [Platanthera guangdongensis]|uniref:Zinc-metallopeptidase, peroxisomal n=1 Tax=Platanthera guangdongensis TaxID=2320717 RepID=A0ABR2LZS3_9ASPA
MAVGMGDSEIFKSRIDNRQYRRIVLPNSLEALLISDPDTEKSAASMDVSVGSFAEPDGLEGLAHYLEHPCKILDKGVLEFFQNAKLRHEDTVINNKVLPDVEITVPEAENILTEVAKIAQTAAEEIVPDEAEISAAAEDDLNVDDSEINADEEMIVDDESKAVDNANDGSEPVSVDNMIVPLPDITPASASEGEVGEGSPEPTRAGGGEAGSRSSRMVC